MVGGRSWPRTSVHVALVVLVVATGVFAVAWSRRPTSTPPPEGIPSAATVSPRPEATASPSPVRVRSHCPSAGVRPFAPTSVRVPGVRDAVQVITPPREGGVPGTPPLTEAGKHLMAFDRDQGIVPGDPRGNVLLNTHTWPDGTALGNQLLSSMHVGDRVVVRGDRAGTRLCYRVTQRIEVVATRGYDKYYATDGPPQLAIIVCSGVRIAPGRWTHRTIWFARLMT